MAPRRALARRAKRLFGYWRSETRTLRQGLVALVLSTAAGFVAGLTLAHLTGTLTELPGLYVLIPAAVGMRGTIFGAIGARLGTAERRRSADDRPAARRRASSQRRRRGAHDVLVRAVDRGPGPHRLGDRRPAIDPAEPAVDHRGGRRRDRFGLILRDHRRPVGGVDAARLGPRLGVHADGDGARRRDHPPQPVPRHAPARATAPSPPRSRWYRWPWPWSASRSPTARTIGCSARSSGR